MSVRLPFHRLPQSVNRFSTENPLTSYSLAVKHLDFHRFPFFSRWKLLFNRFNKRLTVFAKYKTVQRFSSPSPVTLSPFPLLLRSRRSPCPQILIFLAFRAKSNPQNHFLSPLEHFYRFQTSNRTQNSKIPNLNPNCRGSDFFVLNPIFTSLQPN